MKRLFIGCIVALCAIATILSLVVQSTSLEWLRPIIEEELSEALGLEVQLASSPRLQLTPELEFAVDGVRIMNLPGRPSPYLLEVERLTLEPRLLPLLRRVLVIDSLELYEAELRIEPDAQGVWVLRPDLDEVDEQQDAELNDPFMLSIREIGIYGLDIFYDRFDETDVTTIRLDRFLAQSGGRDLPLTLEGQGEFEGSEFGFAAVTGSYAQMMEPTEPFSVDLHARLREGRLQANGILGDPRTLEGMALRVDAQIADLANGARELGFDMPPLGAVEVGGLLVGRDGVVGIEDMVVKSHGAAPLELEFEGGIQDLLNVEGVDIRMRVAIEDADHFRKFTKLSLSGIPVVAELELEDADGSLGVSGEGELSRPGLFELEVAGDFGDLRGLKDLDLQVGFETTTVDSIFDAFAERLSWRLPRLGPLEAKGRFVLQNGSLGLKEIEVSIGDGEVMEANLVGSVADVLAVRGVMLDGRIQAKSASRIAALFERSIPEIGDLEVDFSVRDADGSLGIESASVRIGRGEDFELHLAGVLDNVLELEEVNFEASLAAQDLAVVGELLELELPQVGPVEFSGEVRGSRTQFSSRGRLRLNETMMHGEFETQTKPDERPTTVVRVESPRLHLPDLFANDRLQGLPRRNRDTSRFDLAEWWGGKTPLPLDVLHSFDAELAFEAERVTGYELLDIRNFRVVARVEDGQFALEDLGADYEGGKVSGRITIDARPVVPKLSLRMETFNIDLTKLMSQFQKDTEYAGYLDLSVRLATRGSHAADMRSNLDGVFGAMLREGMIVNEYSRALSFDILRVSVPSFRATTDDEKPVNCLLALIPIKNGIAEMETLYLEGKKVTVVGEGKIDLVQDKIAIRLTPSLHEPGLVSIAATVDVNGPIANPEVRPIRRSMVTSAIGAIYRNAMRPVSAMGRLAFGSKVDPAEIPDACGAIAQQRVSQMLTEEFEPIDLDTAVEK